MPWTPKDAKRHTAKAGTAKRKRMWSEVANSILKQTGSEAQAVRGANAVVKRAAAKGKRKR